MTDILDDIPDFLLLSETLATGGQPNEAQLAAVGAAGYEVVVNLALPTSSGALPDEAGIARAHGMKYIALPVAWEAPTVADAEAFFDAMDANAGRRVFVHCAANMRVSAFVYLYRTLRQKTPEADAVRDLHRIWEPNERWREFISAMKNARMEPSEEEKLR